MSRPRIDHIGIVVADLERAVAKLAALFPDGPSSRHEMPEVGLLVAKFAAENVTIELLQYTSEAAGFARSTMGDRIGLNHLTVEVADLDQAIADLSQAGFQPQAGFPRPGAHGSIVFFEPDDETGLLLELCCRKAEQ